MLRFCSLFISYEDSLASLLCLLRIWMTFYGLFVRVLLVSCLFIVFAVCMCLIFVCFCLFAIVFSYFSFISYNLHTQGIGAVNAYSLVLMVSLVITIFEICTACTGLDRWCCCCLCSLFEWLLWFFISLFCLLISYFVYCLSVLFLFILPFVCFLHLALMLWQFVVCLLVASFTACLLFAYRMCCLFVVCFLVCWIFVFVIAFTFCVAYLALTLAILMCDGTAGVHVVCLDLCCVSRGHSCCCYSWSVTCVHTVCCLYLCLLFFILTSARDHTCLCPLYARAYSRCLCSWPHWSDSCCSCRVRVGRALDYVSGHVHTWMTGCAMCVFVSGWACVSCELACM